MVEVATGKYPYPNPKKESLFAQLAAIVQEEPPNVPTPPFSPLFHDFLCKCLQKDPAKRASYPELLDHPFITQHPFDSVDLIPWVLAGMERNYLKYQF